MSCTSLRDGGWVDVAVDLLVPPSVSPGKGRRAAHLPGHDARAVRIFRLPRSSLAGRKPLAQASQKPREGRVAASIQTDPAGKLREHRRRWRDARLTNRRTKGRLWIFGFVTVLVPIPLLLEPHAKPREITPPAENLGDVRGVTPYPGFDFGIDHDAAGAITPCRGQRLLDVRRQRCRIAGGSAFPASIEHDQSIRGGTRERSQDLVTGVITPWIALGMNQDPVSNGPDSQRFVSTEKPRDGLLDRLVRDECDQIQRHPRTPEARRVPRSSVPCHLRKYGCSSPRTTSVAPAASSAKHRMSFGWARPSSTGE